MRLDWLKKSTLCTKKVEFVKLQRLEKKIETWIQQHWESIETKVFALPNCWNYMGLVQNSTFCTKNLKFVRNSKIETWIKQHWESMETIIAYNYWFTDNIREIRFDCFGKFLICRWFSKIERGEKKTREGPRWTLQRKLERAEFWPDPSLIQAR